MKDISIRKSNDYLIEVLSNETRANVSVEWRREEQQQRDCLLILSSYLSLINETPRRRRKSVDLALPFSGHLRNEW